MPTTPKKTSRPPAMSRADMDLYLKTMELLRAGKITTAQAAARMGGHLTSPEDSRDETLPTMKEQKMETSPALGTKRPKGPSLPLAVLERLKREARVRLKLREAGIIHSTSPKELARLTREKKSAFTEGQLLESRKHAEELFRRLRETPTSPEGKIAQQKKAALPPNKKPKA